MIPAVLIQKKLDGLAALLAFSALCVLAAYLLQGCAESRPAVYSSELLYCNEKSSTMAESQACEDDVRRRYNRPKRDGGAP